MGRVCTLTLLYKRGTKIIVSFVILYLVEFKYRDRDVGQVFVHSTTGETWSQKFTFYPYYDKWKLLTRCLIYTVDIFHVEIVLRTIPRFLLSKVVIIPIHQDFLSPNT